jgi:hypothetical protein
MPVEASATQPEAAPATQPTASLAAALNRRGLTAPALLYLAGHRPLAFAAGQLLAVAAPLASVLGLPLMGWARLLSSPEDVERLQAELGSHLREASL